MHQARRVCSKYLQLVRWIHFPGAQRPHPADSDRCRESAPFTGTRRRRWGHQVERSQETLCRHYSVRWHSHVISMVCRQLHDPRPNITMNIHSIISSQLINCRRASKRNKNAGFGLQTLRELRSRDRRSVRRRRDERKNFVNNTLQMRLCPPSNRPFAERFCF